MKHFLLILTIVPLLISATIYKGYSYPEFYKGIYLTFPSGNDSKRLEHFIEEAKKSGINTFVVDVQRGKSTTCQISKENVQKMLDNGIHPVARIVCFDQGLKTLPVSPAKLEKIYTLAESSAAAGFKELQFDYIRFADKSRTLVDGESIRLSPEKKYAFIQDLLKAARSRVKAYDVRIAADVFGRIPWVPTESHDVIGQKMENFDKVVDVICPMAYPSHYWRDSRTGKNYIALPYETVYKTSKMAREKVEKARIVSWIQSFQLKIAPSGLTYAQYIEEQIKACHDAEITGYIMWNARQEYRIPFKVVKAYYDK